MCRVLFYSRLRHAIASGVFRKFDIRKISWPKVNGDVFFSVEYLLVKQELVIEFFSEVAAAWSDILYIVAGLSAK